MTIMDIKINLQNSQYSHYFKLVFSTFIHYINFYQKEQILSKKEDMATEISYEKNLPSKKDKMPETIDMDFSKKEHKNEFVSEKAKFQSEDSQGSDISYESSIQSEEDIKIGRIQYFKEQMGRFFINYPELINNNIIDKNPDVQFQEEEFANYSKNWSLLSKQILTQSKQSSTFLETLAKRIAVYRSKLEQEDIIDILLQQEKNIMKQIDFEINAKKKQATKGNKNIQNIQSSDNMFFSWRKKQQNQVIVNLPQKNRKIQLQRNKSNQIKNKQRSRTQDRSKLGKQKTILRSSRNQNISVTKSKTFYKDTNENNFFLTSTNQQNQNKNSERILSSRKQTFSQSSKQQNTNQNRSLAKARSIFSKQKQKTGRFNQHLDNQLNNQKQKSSLNRSQNFWKHLVNFDPKTQAGRQLCQLIRKTCNPNDQLAIKRTIMNFLMKNKDMVKNQIIHKSTISQKIQKLYNDDSKELLMFYPTKLNMLNQDNDDLTQNKEVRTSVSINGASISNQGQKFMKLLQQITEGPLMKYWMQLQQNKL